MHGLTGGDWKRKRPDQGREANSVMGNRGAPWGFTTYRHQLPPRQPPTLHRMSSGSYFPPPVRAVEIPKSQGGIRILGVPTVGDRVAQTVVARRLEEKVEPIFHPDSYGYRPGRWPWRRSPPVGDGVGRATG